MESDEEFIENNSDKKGTNKEITLEELYRRISLDIPLPDGFDTSAVMFIGLTKEGKTTLFNYLKGAPLRAVTDENDLQERLAVVSDDPNDDYGIEIGYGSRTTIPKNFQNYWDLPGFAGDTRSPTQDIINSWLIRSLCMNLKKIKIVLVISEENLSSYVRLAGTLKALGEIFPDIDKKDPLSSLCMIVTKGRNTRIEKVRKSLANMLAEQRDCLDKRQRKIFSYFAKEESPIAFFSRPREEGLVRPGAERLAIIEAIQSASWYENPRMSPGVSQESRNILLKLKEREIDDFSRFIRENAPRILYKYVKEALYSGSGSSKDFEGILQGLEKKIASLCECEGALEIQNALDLLEDVNKDLQDKDLEDFLLNKQKHLDFIAQFDPILLSRDVADRLSFLTLVHKNLSSLRDPPSFGKIDGLITLEGRMISSADINDALSNNSSSTISEINVYASVAVFLDDTIIAPGVTLVIISPLVQVFKTPMVYLSGKQGERHEMSKAKNGQGDIISETDDMPLVAACGDSGLPGKPGQNGGSFCVKTKDFKNSQNLSVFSNGGNGGPGQDGGDGAHGANGRARWALKKIQKRDGKARSKRELYVGETFIDGAKKVVKNIFTWNSTYTLFYEMFEEGQKGGDGARPGEGGCGGKPGDIDVGGAPLKEKLQEHGAAGANGEPGKHGSGGKNGPTCVGVFVEEEVLSSLRGQRDVGADSAADVVGSGAVMAGATTVTNSILSKSATLLFGSLVSSSKFLLTAAAAPLATGVAACLVFKTATSFISKSLTTGWLIQPHEVEEDKSDKASDGKVLDGLNGEDRKDSDPVLRINLDEKMEKHGQILEKEENMFAKQ